MCALKYAFLGSLIKNSFYTMLLATIIKDEVAHGLIRVAIRSPYTEVVPKRPGRLSRLGARKSDSRKGINP